ncbi:hypothetical protein GWI33_006967 [Rhynchophorus ferrugineus]|uniref:Uncharacterized protein n=1 Tax=Rhynchophorus ferrugineus TaxID=354439 RepID=A0A834MIM2_RHYFE|nr:hypothetical protein GWI33_006967 [Rhynchophorus ferrugineus]
MKGNHRSNPKSQTRSGFEDEVTCLVMWVVDLHFSCSNLLSHRSTDSIVTNFRVNDKHVKNQAGVQVKSHCVYK